MFSSRHCLRIAVKKWHMPHQLVWKLVPARCEQISATLIEPKSILPVFRWESVSSPVSTHDRLGTSSREMRMAIGSQVKRMILTFMISLTSLLFCRNIPVILTIVKL
ncbi:uncharacterized protein LOC121369674 [Gigantopelta aegis]|uniref:uncharacterized protein LOC121369674 n=1 Tax=Gigantopelta aegis TaxID=1735272 RepID=UPI001B88C766|nr:uncharacterized protein LOC121369674 [Gigantopelta aegis]